MFRNELQEELQRLPSFSVRQLLMDSINIIFDYPSGLTLSSLRPDTKVKGSQLRMMGEEDNTAFPHTHGKQIFRTVKRQILQLSSSPH